MTALSAIALMSFISVGTVYAEDTTTTPQAHDVHHPEATTPAVKDAKSATDKGGMRGGNTMGGDMMGKMDMSQMMGTMHECMEQHKDGKMCDHEMMNKCQEKMSKGDCQKMMKQAKKEEKSKNK